MQRLAVFACVGSIATAVQYAILVCLVDGLGTTPARASAVGYAVSTLLNYLLNRRFTFDSRERHLKALPRFLAVSSVGLALNTAIVWAMTVVVQSHYLISQLLATVMVLIWNFQLNRRWTFAADE